MLLSKMTKRLFFSAKNSTDGKSSDYDYVYDYDYTDPGKWSRTNNIAKKSHWLLSSCSAPISVCDLSMT